MILTRRRAVWLSLRTGPSPESNERWIRKEVAAVERRANQADVLVVVDAGTLLGSSTFVPDAANPWAEMLEDGEASIRMLAVDPVGPGPGSGRTLLNACIGRARALGRGGIFLHSTPWMAAAHRLYGRAGFVRVPQRDWLPVPEVPLLAFRLDLGRPTTAS